MQENGKYVVPALIEKALQEADSVQQVRGVGVGGDMVFGFRSLTRGTARSSKVFLSILPPSNYTLTPPPPPTHTHKR